MKKITIAIDGPVCSGKGTLSIALAKKLGVLYLYTGGMYRALTLAAIRERIDPHNEDKILELLANSDITLSTHAGETEIYLNGEEIGREIIDPSITNVVSIIAQHPKVREEMVRRQKEIVHGKSAVIEGRDIAEKVAPNAEVKIYLTADIKTRAKRRLMQYEEKGIEKTFEEVSKETEERDKKDSERIASPLSIHPDAIIIDTSHDSIDATVEKVLKILKEKGLYDTD